MKNRQNTTATPNHLHTAMTRYLTRTALFSLALILSLAACDSPTSADLETDLDGDLAALTTSLSTELSMTADQTQAVEASMARHSAGRVEPGFLWYVAAELQATLTAEQKERLFQRTEDMSRFRDRGPGRGLGPNGFQGADGIETPAYAGPHGPASTGMPRGNASDGSVGGMRPNETSRFGPFGLIEDLLTDEQKAELVAVRIAYNLERRELIQARRAGTIDNATLRTEMARLRTAERAAMEAVLTAEQLDAFYARRDASREAYEAWAEAVRAARNDALDVTADQADALDALYAEQRAAYQEFMEAFRAEELSASELQAELDALRAAEAVALQEILDDVQYEIVLIHDALAFRHVVFRMEDRFVGPPEETDA